jgi:trans-2,3-dihydro-3-hydroxyanthranilate isomerase
MQYDFVIVDVFTDSQFGGNQLAVVLDAQGLTAAQMQAVAREFNFAETTFVLPAQDAGNTARLRIFSPGSEMPFAGHPTVGSAAVLVRRGLAGGTGTTSSEVVFEEEVGPVRVTVRDDRCGPYSELALEAELDRPSERPDTAALARALSLPVEAVHDVWFAGVGLPFCFCQVATAADVDAAVLDKAALAAALGDSWAQHVFFFAGELVDGGDVYARMFAPSLGIDEDPATGSASAALVGCLAANGGNPDAAPTLTIRQGFAMGRPSVIQAAALMEDGRLRRVSVGGHVVEFATGRLEVPSAEG